MVEREFWEILLASPRGDLLRNFGVGRIPLHGLGLHRQRDGRVLLAAHVLQAPDVDFRDQLKPTLRGLLEVLPEEIPVVGQGDNGQRLTEMFSPTKRLGERRSPSHLSVQMARRCPRSGEGHGYADSLREIAGRASKAMAPSYRSQLCRTRRLFQ